MDVSFLKPVSLKSKCRLGRQQDGGYVVYEPALRQTDLLITYGVGWDTSFEEAFQERYKKPAYLFDHTMFGRHSMADMNLIKTRIKYLQFRKLVNYLRHINSWKIRLQR